METLLAHGKYFPLEEFKAIQKGKEVEKVRYQTIEEVPDYAKETIQKMLELGVLKGNESGFDLSEDMLRIFVIFDRSGLFDK